MIVLLVSVWSTNWLKWIMNYSLKALKLIVDHLTNGDFQKDLWATLFIGW